MKPLRGIHVFLIVAGAFSIIIGANGVLAWNAVRSFPGLDVKNTYVDSQSFDARRAAQESLGWTAWVSADADTLRIRFTGRGGEAVIPAIVTARIGRKTTAQDDTQLALVRDGDGFAAPHDNAAGRWMVFLKATADDGTVFEQRIGLDGVK